MPVGGSVISRGDRLLIYRIDDDTVYLARIGTHADLFE